MRRSVSLGLACLVLALGLWAAFHDARDASAQGPGGPGGPPPGGPPPGAPGGPRPGGPPPGGPGMRPPTPAALDSFAAERDSLMKVVLAEIAGKENTPAESVFKNIKALKGVPAGRLPRIMAMGWGRALGVRCRHCHVQDHWADDDKPQKQIARDMSEMSRTINAELLPKIKNLKSAEAGSPHPPTVNCTTCHRGQREPALGM